MQTAKEKEYPWLHAMVQPALNFGGAGVLAIAAKVCPYDSKMESELLLYIG